MSFGDGYSSSKHIKISEMRLPDKGIKEVGQFLVDAAENGATHWHVTLDQEWYGRDIVAYRQGSEKELAMRDAEELEARAARLRERASSL